MLLLDEPTAGMNPQESAQFVDFVHRVRDEKEISILLIEHDMSVVMRVCERITVLDRGEKIAEGAPDEIRNNPRVIEAYLGKSGTAGGNGSGRSIEQPSDRTTRRDDRRPTAARGAGAADAGGRRPARLLRQHRRGEGPEPRRSTRARSSR